MLSLKWIGIGLFWAAILYYILRWFRIDGFQTTAQDDGSGSVPIKDEVCNILKGVHDSVQSKISNFDQTNLGDNTKNILEISLAGINKQLAAQGCK
jgi:hypothetical protein